MFIKELRILFIFIGIFTVADAITSFFSIPGTGVLAFLGIIFWLAAKYELEKKDKLTPTEKNANMLGELIALLGTFALAFEIGSTYSFYPQICGTIGALIWIYIRTR